MTAAERAAEVLSEALCMDDYPDWHRSMTGIDALADAGLLLTDADRAVLAAADDYVTFIDQRGCSSWSGPTYDYMIAAVRARRETQP